MRQIRVFEHISLDGVIQPDGDDAFANGGWSTPYRSAAGAASLVQAQGSGFDLLLGRRTYDRWAGFWPQVKDGPFAANLNAATKFVVTHRPAGLNWGPAQDLGADILEGISRLKATAGPPLLVWGSSTLVPVLLEHALVDELVLLVYPIVLGSGTRCFPPAGSPRKFELASTQVTPTGVLLNTYRSAGTPDTGR